MVWYGVIDTIWYMYDTHIVWYGIWFEILWCGTVVWCGVVWCGAVRCGAVRCGVVSVVWYSGVVVVLRDAVW